MTPGGQVKGSAAAGATILFGASILNVLLGFASGILIARALGPTGKGAYDITLATSTLLALVLGLSLSPGITFVVAQGASNIRRLLAVFIAFAIAQGLVGALLVIGVSGRPIGTLFLPENLGASVALPIGLFVAGTQVNTYARAAVLGYQRFHLAAVLDIAARGFTLLAMVVALLSSPPGTDPTARLIMASAVGAVAAGILGLGTALRLPPTPQSPAGIRRVIHYSVPVHAANVMQFLNYRLDIFIVNSLLGQTAVGLYALAGSLAQLIWLLPNAVATVILPSVASEPVASASARRTATASRITLAATVTMATAMAVVAPLLVPVLYGPAFGAAVFPLLLLLPGAAVLAVMKVLASYLAGRGRPGLNGWVAVLALMVTLVLDLALIPSLGIAGAAAASTASYACSSAVALYFYRKLAGRHYVNPLIATFEDARLVLRTVSKRSR